MEVELVQSFWLGGCCVWIKICYFILVVYSRSILRDANIYDLGRNLYDLFTPITIVRSSHDFLRFSKILRE